MCCLWAGAPDPEPALAPPAGTLNPNTPSLHPDTPAPAPPVAGRTTTRCPSSLALTSGRCSSGGRRTRRPCWPRWAALRQRCWCPGARGAPTAARPRAPEAARACCSAPRWGGAGLGGGRGVEERQGVSRLMAGGNEGGGEGGGRRVGGWVGTLLSLCPSLPRGGAVAGLNVRRSPMLHPSPMLAEVEYRTAAARRVVLHCIVPPRCTVLRCTVL